MARTYATVDGITLSAQQISSFHKAINEPEVLPLKCLDKVVRSGSTDIGVVIIGDVQKSYIKGKEAETLGSITVVDRFGNGYTFRSTEDALRSWRRVS